MDTLDICVYLGIYILLILITLRDSLFGIDQEPPGDQDQHEC